MRFRVWGLGFRFDDSRAWTARLLGCSIGGKICIEAEDVLYWSVEVDYELIQNSIFSMKYEYVYRAQLGNPCCRVITNLLG